MFYINHSVKNDLEQNTKLFIVLETEQVKNVVTRKRQIFIYCTLVILFKSLQVRLKEFQYYVYKIIS